MKKELKINTENLYYNECWSFEYFSIIDNYSEHLFYKYIKYNSITNNENYDLIYGENGTPYNFKLIFADILYIKNYDYNSISYENIVKFIKKSLKEDKYVIILLLNITDFYFHEYLFVGFDDEKQVFTYPALIDSKVEMRIIKYVDVYNMYKHTSINLEYIYKNYFYKFDYFDPIMCIKLKKLKNKYNPSINDFYLFLKKTINYCWLSGKTFFYNEYKYYYYNGILGVINVILLNLDKYKNNNMRYYNFGKNMKTYILYRKFFYDTISFYKKSNKLIISEELFYKKGTRDLENCLFIFLKHEEYDDNIIKTLRKKIINVFEHDFKYINYVYNEVKRMLIKGVKRDE